jgi:hypothetical protein
VPLSLKLTHTLEDASVTTPQERARVYGQSDHVRLYAADYYDRLAEAGFKIELWNAFERDPERAVQWNLNPLERICIAWKK